MITDFFGRRFSKGDTIVYPLRKGSSMWLESAEVIDVGNDKLKILKPNGQKTTIKNFFNCIIAPADWSPSE